MPSSLVPVSGRCPRFGKYGGEMSNEKNALPFVELTICSSGGQLQVSGEHPKCI